jgi:hypothetical protein
MLAPWLFAQVVAQSIVVLSLAITTFFGFLLSIASTHVSFMALSIGGAMILTSTWKVYERAKRRERNLYTGTPLVTYDLHEWLHYSIGAIGCGCLSFANLWFLTALAFCIYSLVCGTKIANASRAKQEDRIP